jgi:O-antigen/teichoic acid export membrane protein
MRFFRNLAGVLLTTAVSAPIGLLTSILLARLLSTDDRGLYALALSFATMATTLFQFGWPTASIFRLRNAGTSAAEVAGGAFVFLGGVLSLVALAGVVLEPLLRERFLSGLPLVVFFLTLATLPARGLANGFGAIARGIDHFRYENWYALGLQLGNLLAIALALLWLEGALVEVIWAQTFVYFFGAACLIATVLRQTGFSLRLRSEEMGRSFRFGMRTYAIAVTGRIHERADIFMLAYLLADPAQIAFYAIAKGGIQLLQLLPNALGKVAYPQLAGLDSEEAASFACALVRQGLLLMVPASLVLFVAAPILLPFVYGEAYAASSVPFMLMVPGVILLGVDRVLSRYFTGTNQHNPNAMTRAASLAVNLLLNWLWIPKYGIAGSAAAALVSYIVDAVLLIAVFLIMTDRKLGDLLIVGRADLDPYRRQLELLTKRLGRGAGGP